MTWTTPPVSDRAPDGTEYDLTGPLGAPLVVLIHGLGLARGIWEPVIPTLAQDFRVLSYDLYGHGGSAPTPRPADLKLYADQIVGVLDHLNVQSAHLVGFSIGGMINRRFALDYPDRVASLAILNSPHDRGEDGQKLVEERAASVRDQGAFSTFDAALARWFTPAFRDARGDVMDQVRDWRAAADAESYAQAAWVLANGVRELIAPDPAVKAPTLVMTCENDSGSTPAMSEAIAGEIAGAELRIVPELQHLGLMERPELFADLVKEFLKKVVS